VYLVRFVLISGAALAALGLTSCQRQGSQESGVYTAQAAQSDDAGNVGTSAPVTFKTPPAVSVTSPVEGVGFNISRPTFSGLAGSAARAGGAACACACAADERHRRGAGGGRRG